MDIQFLAQNRPTLDGESVPAATDRPAQPLAPNTRVVGWLERETVGAGQEVTCDGFTLPLYLLIELRSVDRKLSLFVCEACVLTVPESAPLALAVALARFSDLPVGCVAAGMQVQVTSKLTVERSGAAWALRVGGALLAHGPLRLVREYCDRFTLADVTRRVLDSAFTTLTGGAACA